MDEPKIREPFSGIVAGLARLRSDVTTAIGQDDLHPDEAAGYYLAVDRIARKLLVNAVRQLWPVPEDGKRKAIADPLLGPLVSLAEEYAPLGISRRTLGLIRTDFHPVRNALEHKEHDVSPRDVLEYLEIVESLAQAIAEPTAATLPEKVLDGFDDYVQLGAYELFRDQLASPWYVVHARRSRGLYSDHLVEFWRLEDGRWQRKWTNLLPNVGMATVAKVSTRAPSLEEMLIWCRRGESMGMMSYDLVAADGPDLLRLLHSDDVGAHIELRGKYIDEVAGDRVVRFEWDGAGFVGHRVVRFEPTPVDTRDVRYRVRDGKVIGPTQVVLRPGQKMRLLRDDFEMNVVRVLSTERSEFVVIPDVYDWDHALRVKVIEGDQDVGEDGPNRWVR